MVNYFPSVEDYEFRLKKVIPCRRVRAILSRIGYRPRGRTTDSLGLLVIWPSPTNDARKLLVLSGEYPKSSRDHRSGFAGGSPCSRQVNATNKSPYYFIDNYFSIELVSLRFLQLTPDEVELVKLLHHHMQTEEYGVDETLPQYLTLPRNTGPNWRPRARITEIEEAWSAILIFYLGFRLLYH